MLAAQNLEPPLLETAAADYDIVRRAITFISENFRDQPKVETIAAAAGTDTRDLTELFRRWCGLSPKAFLEAVTLNHAKQILRETPSVLDASYELGLSGAGRLHDLFVVHEAMSPGEWKTGGAGLGIFYGVHATPLAARPLCAGSGTHERACPAHLRSRRVAAGDAAPRRAHRHRF